MGDPGTQAEACATGGLGHPSFVRAGTEGDRYVWRLDELRLCEKCRLGEVGGQHGSASHGKEGVVFADARELQNDGGIEPAFVGFDEKCF